MYSFSLIKAWRWMRKFDAQIVHIPRCLPFSPDYLATGSTMRDLTHVFVEMSCNCCCVVDSNFGRGIRHGSRKPSKLSGGPVRPILVLNAIPGIAHQFHWPYLLSHSQWRAIVGQQVPNNLVCV